MPVAKGLRYLKRVRARGKWYGYFDTGQKDDRGKRIHAPLGNMSAPDFTARYAAMLGHRARRSQIRSEMTVPRMLDLYQKSEKYRTKAASTKKVYDLYIGEFAKKLPTAPAAEIEQKDVTLFLDDMADRPAAANLALGAISAFFSWGRKRGYAKINPCENIDVMEMGEHHPWPEWLLKEGLTAKEDRVRFGVNLLYYTAQRITDVCNMRWGDINDDAVVVTQQKTGTRLVIPLHEDLRKVLATIPRKGISILTRFDGMHLSANSLRAAIKKFVSERTKESFVPHGLRKNAVIALLENECSIAETAAISGQSLAMVEHYAKGRNQEKLGRAAILKWERKA